MVELPFAADSCPCVREAANRVTIRCWYQRRCGAVGVHLSVASSIYHGNYRSQLRLRQVFSPNLIPSPWGLLRSYGASVREKIRATVELQQHTRVDSLTRGSIHSHAVGFTRRRDGHHGDGGWCRRRQLRRRGHRRRRQHRERCQPTPRLGSPHSQPTFHTTTSNDPFPLSPRCLPGVAGATYGDVQLSTLWGGSGGGGGGYGSTAPAVGGGPHPYCSSRTLLKPLLHFKDPN
jgi:hypothetical protein